MCMWLTASDEPTSIYRMAYLEADYVCLMSFVLCPIGLLPQMVIRRAGYWIDISDVLLGSSTLVAPPSYSAMRNFESLRDLAAYRLGCVSAGSESCPCGR